MTSSAEELVALSAGQMRLFVSNVVYPLITVTEENTNIDIQNIKLFVSMEV